MSDSESDCVRWKISARGPSEEFAVSRGQSWKALSEGGGISRYDEIQDVGEIARA